jgi:hypothetical protein
MGDVLKILFLGAAIIVGAVGGAIGAFFATAFACGLVDWVRGAGGGDGIVTVGWLFCLITVPIGFFYGGGFGLYLATRLVLDDDV